MKNTQSKIAALLAVLVIAIGGASLYAANRNGDKTENTPTETAQTAQQTAEVSISEDKKTVSYEGQTGKTALEVLKSLTSVSTLQSNFGEFVSGINGVEAESNKEYWAFYVNGTLSNEGAGTYKTTDGEKLEWRLEAL